MAYLGPPNPSQAGHFSQRDVTAQRQHRHRSLFVQRAEDGGVDWENKSSTMTQGGGAAFAAGAVGLEGAQSGAGPVAGWLVDRQGFRPAAWELVVWGGRCWMGRCCAVAVNS